MPLPIETLFSGHSPKGRQYKVVSKTHISFPPSDPFLGRSTQSFINTDTPSVWLQTRYGVNSQFIQFLLNYLSRGNVFSFYCDTITPFPTETNNLYIENLRLQQPIKYFLVMWRSSQNRKTIERKLNRNHQKEGRQGDEGILASCQVYTTSHWPNSRLHLLNDGKKARGSFPC